MSWDDSQQDGQQALSAVPDEKLERLFALFGIGKEFIEFSGNIAKISLPSRLGILRALGFDLHGEADVDRLIEQETRRRWDDWVEPAVLIDEGEYHFRFACGEDEAGEKIAWRIQLEGGGEPLSGSFRPADYPEQDRLQAGERCFHLRRIALPALPCGYHQLELSRGDKQAVAQVIVAPRRCHEPDWLRQSRRIWGISAQLYSLCSARNWGIGDFTDLRVLAQQAAARGADFVLLNPFHALSNRYPEDASPYSPIDRRFLNPLYIDPSCEVDFKEAAAVQALLGEPGFDATLAALRDREQVDYAGVFALKYRLFDRMFQHFRERHWRTGTERGMEFDDFLAGQGGAIREFAGFQAETGVAATQCGDDPDFHLYLQWLAERQLADCQRHALAQGMKVGLIRDLAVGGGADSCEVRCNPDLFCLNARIGAPPDNFNPEGQNWGLPPLRPDALKQSAFEHYITLLRENMRACGGLRIDHVMGLMRLWWCPCDGSNASGAYVYYPVDAMFAILRLESQRARCLVIGEDLGVVPPEIRGYIDRSGLLSNVIFYFEKYDGWHFKQPRDWPHRALAFIANHDVPTLQGWWNLHDLALRRELGLIPDDEQLARDRDYRRGEKGQVLDWLAAQQLLPQQWQDHDLDKPFDAALCRAIFHCCGLSASLMLSLQVDDIAGMEDPVNVPGIGFGYPNWRRKVSLPVERLFAREETDQLLAGLRAARPPVAE